MDEDRQTDWIDTDSSPYKLPEVVEENGLVKREHHMELRSFIKRLSVIINKSQTI